MILKKITSDNIGEVLKFAEKHFAHYFGEIDNYKDLSKEEKKLYTEEEFYNLFDFGDYVLTTAKKADELAASRASEKEVEKLKVIIKLIKDL